MVASSERLRVFGCYLLFQGGYSSFLQLDMFCDEFVGVLRFDKLSLVK